jgi:hypothetical protein
MTACLLALLMLGPVAADPAKAEESKAGASQAAAAAETAAAVRALVRELDAPQRTARDDAEKRLIEVGVPALEYLPAPGTAPTAESSDRINRVRKALYRLQVEASVGASNVSLDVKDASLDQVLDEINKQTGNQLVDYRRQFGQRAGDDKITLRLDKRPFWQALDELLATQKLEIYHFSGEDGLAIVTAGDVHPQKPPVAYSGAFRVEAEQMTAVRRLNSDGSDLQIDLSAAWEPRLKPMFLTASMAKISATDDAGNALVMSNPDLNMEIPPQGKSSRVEVAINFVGPPRGVKTIARLRGTIDVLLPAELHEFRFTKLDGGRQTRQGAAVTVTIERARINNEVLEVPLRLSYENAGNALESHRAWFYKNPAYLESPDGEKIAPGTIELARQSDDEIVLNLLFGVEGDWKKHALVYQTPADIVTVPVEFEFRDLPLP